MKLDISKAFNLKDKKFPFEKSGEIVYNDGRICFEEPFSIKGEFSCDGDSALVEMNIIGKVNYICDRCGESCEKDVDIAASECAFPEGTVDADYTFKSGEIDLDEMAIHNVLLSLPMQLLCKENCKGVCLGCYANLNKEECRC